MNIVAKAFGGKRTGTGESDIRSLTDDKNGLSIVVEAYTKSKPDQVITVLFKDTRGYRVLDEGDLIRYDDCDEFRKAFCVYEILSGGWAGGEIVDEGILSITKAVGIREWFVSTTNSCANVFSSSDPSISYA